MPKMPKMPKVGGAILASTLTAPDVAGFSNRPPNSGNLGIFGIFGNAEWRR
jgi:hypothetical protein